MRVSETQQDMSAKDSTLREDVCDEAEHVDRVFGYGSRFWVRR